jgi:hypothetical protein
MGTSIKGVTSGKIHLGLRKSLGEFYEKTINFSLQNTLPYEMLTHGVPYEATRTYRSIKSEFERKRSEAIVLAHSLVLRGF